MTVGDLLMILSSHVSVQSDFGSGYPRFGFRASDFVRGFEFRPSDFRPATTGSTGEMHPGISIQSPAPRTRFVRLRTRFVREYPLNAGANNHTGSRKKTKI
jgi:hypothetical protein